MDARAPTVLALLANPDTAASAVSDGALLQGYAVGDRITVASSIDGSHNVFRADVTQDGVRKRLFARLTRSGNQLDLLALIGEPPEKDTGAQRLGLQRYQDAWNVDAAGRDAALQAGFAVAGDYVDPQIALHGRAALKTHIDGFHSSVPFSSVMPQSGTVVVGDVARFRWTTSAGPVGIIDGEDLVVLDRDGRVSLVMGFWDRDPSPL